MDGWGFLEKGAELARRGESFALATVVWRQGPSSGKESCRAIITASGQLHGWIGGACAEPVVIRQAREVIAEGVPRLLLLGTAEQFGGPLRDGTNFVPISCQSEGSLEVYIEPVQPAPHLIVVGHSPMTRTLAELARVLGWRADVIAGEAFTAADATQRSIVVVATQGHHDGDAVTEAMAARSGYVGLVGSARRGGRRCSVTSPNAACPRATWTRCTSPRAWTWARPRIRKSLSRSSPSWSGCAPQDASVLPCPVWLRILAGRRRRWRRRWMRRTPWIRCAG